MGFIRRPGKGSHTIFSKESVEEMLNLQPKGGKAKPYQVKQVRDLILKYQLEIKSMRYELILYRSKADESFVVEVPALPGCRMAAGATDEEDVVNAQSVIGEWIDTARSLGRRR